MFNITRETWGKCGIKTVKYCNKKTDIIELWNKMSNIEIQPRHSNIYDIALKRIRKYCGKKYKTFFKNETGIFVIEKLTRDIIEHCKLHLIKNLITENQIFDLKIIILLL